MRSVKEVVAELREAGAGRHVWRVQRKDDKSYCIEFTDREKPEAEQWWKENSKKRPEFYADFELARVHLRSKADNLMLESAELLESLAVIRIELEPRPSWWPSYWEWPPKTEFLMLKSAEVCNSESGRG